MSDDTQLLPEAVRRRLDPLMLVSSKIRSGAMKGERRSTKRGTSIEFADYRNYVAGDDLRKLDWNVYARLDKPYIKLLEDEEDLAVHLLLDTSASMNWQPEERPHEHKFTYTQRLAAGLSYVALLNNDRLTLQTLNAGAPQSFGPVRGRGQIVALLRQVQRWTTGGETDLNAALRTFALREKRAGLVFLLTDLFSPGGYLDGLNLLLGKGHEVVLLHVLCSDELNPPLTGDLRLVDVETGVPQEVTIDGTLRTIYQQRLTHWLDSICDDCSRRGVHYALLPTSTPFEQVLLFDLRKLGLMK
jgi:uncharacterized protein (DUF58 family)